MLSKARLFLNLTLLIGARNLGAASNTVWQTGNFDKSSREFAAEPAMQEGETNTIDEWQEVHGAARK